MSPFAGIILTGSMGRGVPRLLSACRSRKLPRADYTHHHVRIAFFGPFEEKITGYAVLNEHVHFE